MGRRAFEGQEWAQRDLRWVAAFLLMLALFAANPVFGWGLLALAVAFTVRVTVYVVAKRRRERAHDEPFWVDELGS